MLIPNLEISLAELIDWEIYFLTLATYDLILLHGVLDKSRKIQFSGSLKRKENERIKRYYQLQDWAHAI